jgi:hypothetical protein
MGFVEWPIVNGANGNRLRTVKARPLSRPANSGALVLLLVLLQAGQADVLDDLTLLRNRCLYYSVGRAPNDSGTLTIRHDLYAQSPFSPPGEIDLAASGFALAALPAAVECGLISSSAAGSIASNAAVRVLELVTHSASATNADQYGKYGYKGMLYHYYTWSEPGSEFRGNAGTEVSSVDTVLLMYGLVVCADYFGGPTASNCALASTRIAWTNWLDTSTLGHVNQFRMSYQTNSGFQGWWDWRSDETTLLCLYAAASDTNLDAQILWNAWRRDWVTYVSPASNSFTCYASWNGDPFTDFYALTFLDTSRFPPDFNSIDWFQNSRTSYLGHVEFFRTERSYRDAMTFAFIANAANPIAAPKSDSSSPPLRTDCPLYALAGGLSFYAENAESNEIARTLSKLITNSPGTALFDWHGWPVEAINATDALHPVVNSNIVGQDICSIALSIDNYLAHRTQDIVLRDARFRRVLSQVFPPRAAAISLEDAEQIETRWQAVPFSGLSLHTSTNLHAAWTNQGFLIFDAEGAARTNRPAAAPAGFYRLSD